MANRAINIDINVTVQADLNQPGAPASIYDWSSHAYELFPGGSAADLMAWEPKQVVYLCGRMLYLSEMDGIESGDGHEADLACMANAVWDWVARKPRDAGASMQDRLLVIDRLRVDEESQGHGYGRRTILELLRHHPHMMVATIPVADDRTVTTQQHLLTYWSKLGFAPTSYDSQVYCCYT